MYVCDLCYAIPFYSNLFHAICEPINPAFPPQHDCLALPAILYTALRRSRGRGVAPGLPPPLFLWRGRSCCKIDRPAVLCLISFPQFQFYRSVSCRRVRKFHRSFLFFFVLCPSVLCNRTHPVLELRPLLLLSTSPPQLLESPQGDESVLHALRATCQPLKTHSTLTQSVRHVMLSRS